MALGTNGYYFCHNADGGNAWCLKDEDKNHIGLQNGSADQVEKVWLGYNGAYVSQRASGAKAWNLKGHYGTLEHTLRYAGCKILALGLNLENGMGYFIVFEDGRMQYNPAGSPLPNDKAQDWVGAVFG